MTAAVDSFADAADNLNGPYAHAAAVSPSDSTDLTNATRGLCIGTAGALKVNTVGGETVVFGNVPAGVLPIRVTRVWNTGTAASNITALW